MTLTVGSLCTGYGGAELALTLAGWKHELVFVADPDPAASRVLAHHHPDVPNLGDITRVAWDQLGLAGEIDLLAAGFPCQDVSSAGRRAGLGHGTRSGVWSHVATTIDVLRPRLALLENVAALLSTPANRSTDGADSDLEPGPADLGDGADRPVLRAIGAVLGDLADLGYDAVWQVVSAASVGAPHLRKRVFILAWPAADPPRPGHGHAGPAGRGGVPAATVGGGAQAGELSLLPTPNAALGRGTGMPSVNTAERRMYAEGRRFLDDAVALLPTPAARDAGRGFGYGDQPGRPLSETIARLLPTPTAGDGAAGPGNGGREGSPNLRTEVTLLPTPRATDGTKGGPNQRGSSGDLMLPSAVVQLLPTPTATPYGSNQSPSDGAVVRPSLDGLVRDPARWGEYAPAIAQWEQVIGRPAPDPTEPGKNGQPRLSPAFVEWMQGLPAGYVIDVPGVSRNDTLRLLGNGIVPLQGAAAITQLAAIVAAITGEPIEVRG